MVATRTTEKPKSSCRNACQVKPSWIATGTTQHTSRTDAAAIAHATADAAVLDDRTGPMVARCESGCVRAGTDHEIRTGTDAHELTVAAPWAQTRTHSKESHHVC